MKIASNHKTILWATGVLQPCSQEEIFMFLVDVYEDESIAPSKEAIGESLKYLEKFGRVARVGSGRKLYSLTMKGHSELSFRLRSLRDNLRIFLLKKARNSNIDGVEDDLKDMGGDSQSIEHWLGMKNVPRPFPKMAADFRAVP